MLPVIIERLDGIIIFTINRPESNNRINNQVIQCMSDVCDEIASGNINKVLIITGVGEKYFSMGIEESEDTIQNLSSITSLISNIRCPVIAAINGDAFGAGLELALACDIRVAVPNVHFCLPDIKNGLIPSNGGTQRLPRIVGITKAMELILTGEPIDTNEAYRIGLISNILSKDELLSTIKTMAQTMITKSPIALSYAKEAINKGLDLTLEQGLNLEADLYFLLHTTEDRSEGIKAFREKRKPQFRGL